MSKRSGVLELAVLGLLHESPLHGYELRKRVNTLLGPLRAISYPTDPFGTVTNRFNDFRSAYMPNPCPAG